MTKLQYSSVYAILGTLIVLFILNIGKKTNIRGKSVRRQLYFVWAMNVAYFLTFYFTNVNVLRYLYCIIAALELWILVAFLNFTFEFAGSKIKVGSGWKILTIAFVTIDTFLLIINANSQAFFAFEERFTSAGDIYIGPVVSSFYILHRALCGIVEIAILFVLIYRASRVSYYYRRRYIILSVTFVAVFLICFLFRVCKVQMSYPAVILFTICEV